MTPPLLEVLGLTMLKQRSTSSNVMSDTRTPAGGGGAWGGGVSRVLVVGGACECRRIVHTRPQDMHMCNA